MVKQLKIDNKNVLIRDGWADAYGMRPAEVWNSIGTFCGCGTAGLASCGIILLLVNATAGLANWCILLLLANASNCRSDGIFGGER